MLTNTCSKLEVKTLYERVDCGQNQQQKHQNDVMLYLFLTLCIFSRLIKFVYC